jgi:hypothetical protein
MEFISNGEQFLDSFAWTCRGTLFQRYSSASNVARAAFASFAHNSTEVNSNPVGSSYRFADRAAGRRIERSFALAAAFAQDDKRSGSFRRAVFVQFWPPFWPQKVPPRGTALWCNVSIPGRTSRNHTGRSSSMPHRRAAHWHDRRSMPTWMAPGQPKGERL